MPAQTPFPAIDAPVLRTEAGTPYLQEPGVALLAMPATDLRGMGAFLGGFDAALEFGAYLDDPVALPPAERVVKVAGQLCFDDRTEVLTDQGWSRFPELRPGQRVLTMNPSTLAVEYQTPSIIHAYQYGGDLLSVESRDISLAVTPDHRQFGYFGWKSSADRHFIATKDIGRRKFAVYTSASGWEGNLPDAVCLPDISWSQVVSNQCGSYGRKSGTITGRVYRTKSDLTALAQLIT